VRVLGEVEGSETFDVVEDAPDFVGNARKKAIETAAWLRANSSEVADHDLVVADDSGLVVDALDGAPGVLSARYAGEGASDQDRIDKLLSELSRANAGRSARFVCSLVAVQMSGEERFAHEGRCEGQIAESPRGTGGFGYDPVFLPQEHAGSAPDTDARSFAELSPSEKDAISHRGRALRALESYLRQANAHQTGAETEPGRKP
jgi:XTP/dITP diphosphohydrolase